MNTLEFFGQEKTGRILLKLAPPVMLAQLIQALYNIVDSLFIGRYSDTGLTALSIIYPIQLLMIALAAHESGLDREFISNIHKNAPDILRDLYLSSHAVRMAVRAQNRIIRRIADNGACVIVGRAADYVLRDYPGVVRVFIHAPADFRRARVMEVYGDTAAQAARSIRRSDKARASYYRHISGRRWGEAGNYELTLDSSAGIEECADLIADYVRSLQKGRS